MTEVELMSAIQYVINTTHTHTHTETSGIYIYTVAELLFGSTNNIYDIYEPVCYEPTGSGGIYNWISIVIF